MQRTFSLATGRSAVHIQQAIPNLAQIFKDAGTKIGSSLLVCDENTKPIADIICDGKVSAMPVCVLQPGENHKNFDSCLLILQAAKDAGLGRDGLIIGIGGGVVSDLSAFCASIYMRGIRCALVSTTLLGMADAAFGGKTGFDLFDIKNIVGTFYPSDNVYISTDTLKTLHIDQWKSGMAEIIKTAILDNSIYDKKNYEELLCACGGYNVAVKKLDLCKLISRAVFFKAKIVLSDPRETKGKRDLLNLGHTFGHALETVCTLGTVTHGEAVAWGIARAIDMGIALNITPAKNAKTISTLLKDGGYETRNPHPAYKKVISGGQIRDKDIDIFIKTLYSDKKKKNGFLNFIIPSAKGAIIYPLKNDKQQLLLDILMCKNKSDERQ
ncbi:MAG: hypothetical protein Ta2B_07120 [Termitinemataceae bacterium]|nr:MAG: hypothetical protein Ta2B_07120 [Termitinemataceae bacterium]